MTGRLANASILPMNITPDIIAAAYSYLRVTPPFKSWKLPVADEVEFGVTKHHDREADHSTYLGTGEHIIRVSAYHIKTSLGLLEAVAHEMVHAHQWRVRKETTHSAWFNKTNARVARLHGWPVEVFV